MQTTSSIDLDIQYLPSQEEVFFLSEAQFKVVTKGRRAGFTRGSAQYAIECLLQGKSVLWVDTVQVNLDGYIQAYFMPLLNQLPREQWDYKLSSHELIVHDTKMVMRSAERSENIEGFAYDVIILNEAGIILKGQRGRKLWQSSIYPMIMDFNSSVLFIGTPKGKKAVRGEISETGYCLYYELSQKEHDNDKWQTFNFSSYTNQFLNQEAIEELENDVPLALRDQEIYGMFTDLGGQLIFKDHWFCIVTKLPLFHRRKIMSLDTAFKKGSENDYSAGVVFLETDTDYYWTDCFNEKLNFPGLLQKTISFYNYHKPDVVLIEDKASGPSLIQTLKQETRIPILPIKVSTDKLTRTTAITPFFETGRVKLLNGHWNRMAINQFCEYNGLEDLNDDIIDAVSQLLNYSKRSNIENKPVRVPRRPRQSSILEGF